MRNPEGESRKQDVARNAFKSPEGLHLPSSLQKLCVHMNLKNATIHNTQAHIDTLITEQWVTFQLDHPDRKNFVNLSAGMWQLCSYGARGPAHSVAILSHLHTC